MESKVNIYVLKGPDGKVRYVGASGITLSKRVTQHVSDANSGDTSARCEWIRELLAKGIRPIAEIIEVVDQRDWQQRERYWIAEFRKTCNLTNATDGGVGLINPPQLVRDRISEQVRLNGYKGGRPLPHSEEAKARIGAGVKSSQAFKDGMRNRRKGLIGKSLSTEGKDRIIAAKKKYWADLRATIALQCGI